MGRCRVSHWWVDGQVRIKVVLKGTYGLVFSIPKESVFTWEYIPLSDMTMNKAGGAVDSRKKLR